MSKNTLCYVGEQATSWALLGYAHRARYHDDIEHADRLNHDKFRVVLRDIAVQLGFKPCGKCVRPWPNGPAAREERRA